MLELSYIRTKPDSVKEGLRLRNYSEEELKIVDQIIEVDEARRRAQTELDEILANNNKLSKKVGELFKSGQREEANVIKEQVAQGKESIKEQQDNKQNLEDQLTELLLQVPNVPNPKVPKGNTDADNVLVKEGEIAIPKLMEGAKAHWDLAKDYNIIDFEIGAKITGSGFPLFRDKGARLKRGLINYFLEKARHAGYEEMLPPLLVNSATARATGQLPDKEGQMYHVGKDELYLIPTAEVPLTNVFRDVILEESDLPLKVCGHTPCFRREAGAHGKDTRGLNRVHQFDKVEIVQIAHPDKSYEILEEMVAHVETLLNDLELPYRIVRLCGGDLGFTSALTYDFEVYSAAQQKWLEVSSVSNFLTYQSNRLKLRFRDKDRKTRLAHTLNGSALALARIVASLLENNQTPEGIVLPKALHPFAGFDRI